MFGRKLIWNTSVLAASVIVAALASPYGRADVIKSEDFESYDLGTVNDQGMTWEVYKCSGTVVSPPTHSGNRSLSIYGSTVQGGGTGKVIWWDDVGMHGGMLRFSWWMYITTDASFNMWGMDVYGWGGNNIARFWNNQVGSTSTIDCMKQDGTYEETSALVPTKQWRQVTMEFDLGSTIDQYRVQTGSEPWSSWYTLGSQETYLRRVEFFTVLNGFTGGRSHPYYIDDMLLSLVPEPTSLALIGMGGLSLLVFSVFRCKRKRKAS